MIKDIKGQNVYSHMSNSQLDRSLWNKWSIV